MLYSANIIASSLTLLPLQYDGMVKKQEEEVAKGVAMEDNSNQNNARGEGQSKIDFMPSNMKQHPDNTHSDSKNDLKHYDKKPVPSKPPHPVLDKPKEKPNKVERTEYVSITSGATAAQKKETALQKTARSTTNLNTNATVTANSKLVDAYHIPDGNQHSQGNRQDGFRGNKLYENDGKSFLRHARQESLSKHENVSSISGVSERTVSPYHINSSHSNLAGFRNSNSGPPPRKKVTSCTGLEQPPTSASSSSSREEVEPRSVSVTTDKQSEKAEVRSVDICCTSIL